MTKILGVSWYNNMAGAIGLVLMNNGFEDKAYIGQAPGQDEDADTQYVLDHGAPFPVDAARVALKLTAEAAS